ncbi:tail fiber protein [Undibacterium sp. Jales W-56]|uniref:phage tail protein n=1 Tax=Undibacterium sp. Jales W-56 TaxID=2897325 RepID=UPI0021CF9F3C|nr:tail fiber protein [Undibacterium sp. Jales W-56]MCU6432968.1 tail fiber protein [Undibacterium sp. Jales W-56]
MLNIIRRAAASLLALLSFTSLPAAAQVDPFLGEIRCFAFNFAPKGWAPLNGQLLSISQNTALFALLGTQFGGNGTNNFALPDMRSRSLVDMGQGPGLSSYAMGQTSGAETASLNVANMPAHTHMVAPLGSNNDANSVSPSGKVPAAKARTTLYTDPLNVVSMAGTQTSSTGGGQAFDIRSPTLTVNCAIALSGIFPSQN